MRGASYLSKHDSDGNELWTRQSGGQSGLFANSLAVDGGNVYVVGLTRGALPGQTHLGNTDAFVRKYDDDGNELWARQFGSRGLDMAEDVVVDGSGNLYVLGTTRLSLPGQSNMEPVLGGSDRQPSSFLPATLPSLNPGVICQRPFLLRD